MTAPEREGTEDLDGLRRRLYRADATDADLRHYLDERAAVVPAEPSAAPPRRRRRFLLVGAAAGVLLLAVVATDALLHHPDPATHSARVQPSARDDVPLPAASRRTGGPATAAITIDGTSIAAKRFDGAGNGVLSIHLPSAEFGTLRAVVLVYANRSATISWKAFRPPSEDASVVARARVTTRVALAAPHAFTYAGDPPTRITLTAPAGVQWSLLVAAANGTSGGLH